MTDYQLMHEIINELNHLIYMRGAFSSSEFVSWYIKTENFLENKYGKDSYEVDYFRTTALTLYIHAVESDEDFDKLSKDGLIAIKAILAEYLKGIETEVLEVK